MRRTSTFQRIVFTSFLAIVPISCTLAQITNLVPDKPVEAPNYWCTWYWQNYAVRSGQPVPDPLDMSLYSNPAARETLKEETLFGKDGWARQMLPKTRGEYYFLIDHGWQDKSVKKSPFFSLLMDTADFPRYADLEPKERIKQMNEDIKELGWRGLGLWVRGSPPEKEIQRMVKWSKYAGIYYWKIDGGDTKDFLSYKIKQKIFPELALEYITGSGGPLNTHWNDPNRKDYPSIYAKEFENKGPLPGLLWGRHGASKEMLHMLKNSDTFRTYDAAPLHVSTVTLQRLHDILEQSVDDPANVAYLNVQDDCNIAAALGCVVAVKRHPMNGSRIFRGKDYHHQINGDRGIEKRMDEMGRFIRWQRIAPPMPAGYGAYAASPKRLIDQYQYGPESTWMRQTHGKLVTQAAPAVMARNIPLPEVASEGDVPYVLASCFPNGAICIATEGRVKQETSWYHPRTDIKLEVDDGKEPIGIFGHYASLTLQLNEPLPSGTKILAQDLLADEAVDITQEVIIGDKWIKLPGTLIDMVGTSAATEGDISVPGLVVSIVP